MLARRKLAPPPKPSPMTRRKPLNKRPLDDTQANRTVAPQRDVPRPAAMVSRWPEILIQALFTLVAVALAFGVEEWREDRELDDAAEEARAAIVQEVRHNRDELLESRQDIADSIAQLGAALKSPNGPGAPALRQQRVVFELALLSTAAWRSAQSMEAARRMDYAWMLQVARAYELQTMYEQAQWAAVDANIAFRAADTNADAAANARILLARLRLLSWLGEALEGDYVDAM